MLPSMRYETKKLSELYHRKQYFPSNPGPSKTTAFPSSKSKTKPIIITHSGQPTSTNSATECILLSTTPKKSKTKTSTSKTKYYITNV